VPRGRLFGFFDLSNTLVLYYFVLAIFLAGFLLIYRIVHSPFGNVLKAIRHKEPRPISLGYDAERYKLLAFVLSAALAGLAGATKAIVFQLASLTDVDWPMSGEVVLMALVGECVRVADDAAAAARMKEIESTIAETYFAWSGPPTKEGGAYFRIQGPAVVIEYAPQALQTRGPDGAPEHIHTIYRDPTNDYGARLVKR